MLIDESPPDEPGTRGRLVELCVDGEDAAFHCEGRLTLLDVLRDRLGVTGVKKGCDHGQCGACTVHVDGRAVLACLTLAAAVDGSTVATVHGMATDPRLAQLQSAFVTHDALQCGFCTPGQLMSAAAALERDDVRTDIEIREFMSGNICRCAAYPQIVAAISAVRAARAREESEPRA